MHRVWFCEIGNLVRKCDHIWPFPCLNHLLRRTRKLSICAFWQICNKFWASLLVLMAAGHPLRRSCLLWKATFENNPNLPKNVKNIAAKYICERSWKVTVNSSEGGETSLTQIWCIETVSKEAFGCYDLFEYDWYFCECLPNDSWKSFISWEIKKYDQNLE